jgi:hypothetical protein
MARGEYILFLSIGDWFYGNNVLRHVVPHLDDCDFVYGVGIIYHYNATKHVLEKDFEGQQVLEAFLPKLIIEDYEHFSKQR